VTKLQIAAMLTLAQTIAAARQTEATAMSRRDTDLWVGWKKQVEATLPLAESLKTLLLMVTFG
jgi:hypothetical protein